jgi:hypothetical protein
MHTVTLLPFEVSSQVPNSQIWDIRPTADARYKSLFKELEQFKPGQAVVMKFDTKGEGEDFSRAVDIFNSYHSDRKIMKCSSTHHRLSHLNLPRGSILVKRVY